MVRQKVIRIMIKVFFTILLGLVLGVLDLLKGETLGAFLKLVVSLAIIAAWKYNPDKNRLNEDRFKLNKE